MSKQKTSTDLLIQAIYQQSRENLRKCASKNFICPNIPPSENTDNKTVAIGEQVGVVDCVGEALFNLSITEDELIDLNYLLENIDIDGCYVDFNDERLINSLNSLQLKVNHQLFFNPVGF